MGKGSGQLILVTGASSFVGAHVIKEFLKNGYRVRGQVRSDSSAGKVRNAFPDAGEALETVNVSDITTAGAFDEAVKGVDGVIHTASPFVFQVEDNERDLLEPAVKGTTRILEAVAAYAPQVKRVVITSSFAAIIDPTKGARPGHTYSEADWNPVTYDKAKAGPGPVAYCASKTFAEKAANDFVAEKKPNFTVAAICPPMIYGPIAHDADIKNLNTSVADIYRFMDGSHTEPGPTPFPAFADARNVATAHLEAYERPEAAGQRYLITSGNFQYIDVCRILRVMLPDRVAQIPDPAKTERVETFGVDNSKAQRELGIKFITLDECIRDTALSLLEVEKKSQA
jgi:nucleoside-diphosphate-sugar epimerase